MKNSEKRLYLARYGLMKANGGIVNTVDFSVEEIYAMDDEEALVKAEKRENVLDLVEKLIRNNKIAEEVILISVRNNDSKALIYLCEIVF